MLLAPLCCLLLSCLPPSTHFPLAATLSLPLSTLFSHSTPLYSYHFPSHPFTGIPLQSLSPTDSLNPFILILSPFPPSIPFYFFTFPPHFSSPFFLLTTSNLISYFSPLFYSPLPPIHFPSHFLPHIYTSHYSFIFLSFCTLSSFPFYPPFPSPFLFSSPPPSFHPCFIGCVSEGPSLCSF